MEKPHHRNFVSFSGFEKAKQNLEMKQNWVKQSLLGTVPAISCKHWFRSSFEIGSDSTFALLELETLSTRESLRSRFSPTSGIFGWEEVSSGVPGVFSGSLEVTGASFSRSETVGRSFRSFFTRSNSFCFLMSKMFSHLSPTQCLKSLQITQKYEGLFNPNGIQGVAVITPRTFWVLGVIKVKSAKKTQFLSVWCYKRQIRKNDHLQNS